MNNGTVLLTGISGYIGLHCAQQLLNEGFTVRGSVRSASKAQQVRETLASASADTTNLSIVELDLTSDKGWDDAVKGCDYVMHVASPYAIREPKNADDMIKPAVDGTLRALNAAKKAGVKRVVFTSSTLTMTGGMKTGTVTPEHWTDTNAANVSVYARSKTLAEKAAWDFIASQPSDNAMEFVSVNPGAVFGPPLGKDITGQSLTSIDKMLRGKTPMVPSLAMPMVDVRDVATLHVRSLTTPDAAGKRIIASTEKAWSFGKIAQILKDKGYKGPSTRQAPDFVLRLVSLFDREAKGMVGFLGMNVDADITQTRELFNWSPRPFAGTVLDTAAAVKANQGA